MISETSSSVTSNPALSAGGCLAHHGLRQTGTRDTEMDPKLNTLSRHSSLGEMDAGACTAKKAGQQERALHTKDIWPVQTHDCAYSSRTLIQETTSRDPTPKGPQPGKQNC